MYSYLDTLNADQRKATCHGSSPLLILAGAGSGKTRVICCRISYLIGHYGFQPYNILALTFTNKAAKEMLDRVESQLASETLQSKALIKTFHSFGTWFLRRYGEHLNLSSNFVIFDDSDALALLKEVAPRKLPQNELKQILSLILKAKEEALTPDSDLSHLGHKEDFRDFFLAYQTKLREIGNVDFGDLIALPLCILEENEEIRLQVQNRFPAILVDEYQDTNVAQFKLLKQLYGEKTWLSVVGDDDQSIYRFRGAVVENILTFPQSFKNTEVITLNQNYRSTEYILEAANAVVSNNHERLGKDMQAVRGQGKPLILREFSSPDEEALFCAEFLRSLDSQETAAILYRTNAQSMALEKCFKELKIPYKLVGSVSFFQRQEIKDTLALLSLLHNSKNLVAFLRVINKPTRSLGPASVRTIFSYLDKADNNLLLACELAAVSFKGKSLKGLRLFLSLYSQAKKRHYTQLGELLEVLLEHSGLLAEYRETDEKEHTNRVANIEELITFAKKYPCDEENLSLFLEAMELDSFDKHAETENPAISLITIHNTKGLEYDKVIVVGLEDGLFPSAQSYTQEDVEEERRLFYVAITRAKTDLALCYCRYRFHFGHHQYNGPSSFLREIPPELFQSMEKAKVVKRVSKSDAFTPPPIAILKKNLNKQLSLKFPKGSKVYHDEYGDGYVSHSRVEKGMEVIQVTFVSGQKAKFIPELQINSLTKIEEDW